MTENPAIKRVRAIQEDEELMALSTERATYKGVIQKEALLLAIAVASAFGAIFTGYATSWAILVACFLALFVAIAIATTPRLAKPLAPLYAILEGAALGGVSFAMEVVYPNIVIQAVLLTFCVAATALFVFGKGIVKVDSQFAQAVASAIGAVLLFSIGKLVAIFVFGADLSFIENGISGILIDVVVLCVATASLFVDYEQIKETVEGGLPAEYEWVCAFSLLVGLVWLYIRILEIIRIMRK